MFSLLLSLLFSMTPFAQQTIDMPLEIRAKANLIFGKGEASKEPYFDVVITKQAATGVLVKTPYTRKGGRLTFDLHHRLNLTPDFALPAEVTTVVEIITGGTTTLGTYTLIDTINPGVKFEEGIARTSSAPSEMTVTPYGRKSIIIDLKSGPQSIAVVGHSVSVTRGKTTTRVDTPGARIAMVTKLKFVEVEAYNPLKKP